MPTYNDSHGTFFGRINLEGNVVVLHVEDGQAATRLDCNIYPVGSDLGVRYEHPEGIVISKDDAAKIGLEIEV